MARKDCYWNHRAGGYIEPASPSGFDILVKGTDKYLNFNTLVGSTGYGFRDNSGTMEFKDSGGSWLSFAAGIGIGDMLKATYDPANGAKQVAFADDLTGYVPYTGGTSNVDLGVHNLTVDTNSLFVDSVNHKVGIGTTTPSYKLDVVGDINSQVTGTGSTSNTSYANFIAYNPANGYPKAQFLIGQNASDISAALTVAPLFSSTGVNKPSLIYLSTNKTFSDSGAYQFGLQQDTSLAKIFTIKSDQGTDGTPIAINVGGTEVIRFLKNGNVGIGTTAPSYTLDVNGTTRIGTNGWLFSSNTIQPMINGYLGLDSSNNRLFQITDTGYTKNYFKVQTVAGDNYADISINGSQAFFDNAGNVGIGTTGPTSKLHVVGGLNLNITVVTDTYQVLVTDYTVVCNKATAFTVTMPVAVVGATFVIKNINTGVVTIDGTSTDTIDSSLSTDIAQWESKTLQCYVANKWIVI